MAGKKTSKAHRPGSSRNTHEGRVTTRFISTRKLTLERRVSTNVTEGSQNIVIEKLDFGLSSRPTGIPWSRATGSSPLRGRAAAGHRRHRRRGVRRPPARTDDQFKMPRSRNSCRIRFRVRFRLRKGTFCPRTKYEQRFSAERRLFRYTSSPTARVGASALHFRAWPSTRAHPVVERQYTPARNSSAKWTFAAPVRQSAIDDSARS